jgi:hypothetical protein
LSTITLPTANTRSIGLPSRRRCSTPLGSVTKNQSLMASVTRRLISSGMPMSPLRRPASTCATAIPIFFATIEQASVEFTSPTTTLAAGRASRHRASYASITFAACSAWLPPPHPSRTPG